METDYNLKFGDLIVLEGAFQPTHGGRKNPNAFQDIETTGFLSAIG